MEGSSWRIPPPTNGNNPQQQYQQQHQYSQQQHQLLPPQQQQQSPYQPRGNPPVDSWRNVARENNTANPSATSASPASSSYSSRRDRSRSPRDRSRRRSPDDRRRRSRSRDRYRRRSPDERDAKPRGEPKRIFITQLPIEIQHEPLTMLFARQGFMPSDIKIYDKQDRGSVHSMAIVEFGDAAFAKKWMEQNQGQLTIPDGRKVTAEYVSTSEEECLKRRDWICAKCTDANYQQRETCFRCNISKGESITLEARGFADIGDKQPCDTLLVRDMPAGVNETAVLAVLQRVTQGQLRFGQVKLSDSREFAWVQMRNASDAEMLLRCFQKSPLQIQGSMVITTFSRRPLSVILGEAVVTERPKPVVVEEQQPQMPMQPPGAPAAAAPFGQYGAPPPSMGGMPGMPTGMPPMMAPPSMMPSFGMPPPGMQQPPGAATAAGHMNTSMPPPAFGMPPPGMSGMMQHPGMQQMQQQQPQQQPPQGMPPGMQGMQQAMGMMGQPPVTQHQQQLLQSQLNAAAHMGMMPNMTMPPPGMQQQAPAAAAAPTYYMQPPQQQMQQPQQAADPALLQAQLAAMAAQQAALVAQVEQLAGGAAAAAATATPQQPEKLGHILTPVGLLQQFEPPNPQTFMPEPNSGYMYDANTKLYYDPKTMYFYNMASGKWTYYDAHFKSYIAVDDREKVQQALHDGFGQNGGAATAAADDKKDEKKTPSEIAKEMMKWAKKQDKASKVQMSLKPTVKTLETKSAFGSGIAAAAAAAAGQQPGAAAALPPTTPTAGGGSGVSFGTEVTLKMLDRSKNPLAHLNSDSEGEETPPPAGTHHHHQQRQQLPPQPVKEEPKVKSAAEHREAMMATLIDRAGKQCLLCRRAFPSAEVLDKHIDKSDLHKKNLEEKQIEWGKAYVASIMAATDGRGGGGADYGSVASTSAPSAAAAAPAADSYKYRDRAKERRKVHGIDAITADPFGHSRDSGRGQVSVEALQRESDAAAARPLDSSNKGSKMLQKMGWTEGAGLGKNLQGIVAPIQAERRVEGTGLGLSGSKITHGMHASHQDKTRAALYARYQEQ